MTWEEYRDVPRLGRKKRLTEKQRLLLWRLFEEVRARLDKEGVITRSDMFSRITAHIEDKDHHPFDFASWMRPKTSGLPNCGSWPRWGEAERTACSLPATSASGSSSSRSHGSRWVWISAADLRRSGSTTGLPTRSGVMLTDFFRRLCPMSMAMKRAGRTQFRSSTAPHPSSRPSMTTNRKHKPSVGGFPACWSRGTSRTKSVSSYVQENNCHGHTPPLRQRERRGWI